MKLIVFFLFMMCIQAKAGKAQHINLSLNNASIKQVFKEIEKQTGYHFFYKEKLLADCPKVNVHIKNASLLEALGESIEQLPLTFTIVGKTIIIQGKERVKKRLLSEPMQPLIMAEEIRGIVTDNDGKPLPGVSVMVKSTNKGTTTKSDGSFVISVKKGDILEFSMIGYKNVQVQVIDFNSLKIIMSESIVTGLDEVVVTALGISRQKKSLGYATQVVKSDELGSTGSGSMADALSGQVAGLNIKSSNNMGGSTNIVVRGFKSLTGNNQALFVVDGVPIDNSNYNSSSQKQNGIGYDYGNAAFDINPDDIDNVSVLKGAAATALYGSRAANGVILITTKSGTKSGKPTISLGSNLTFSVIDKTTFPQYQRDYGAGYGQFYGPDGKGYFDMQDVDGDGTPDPVVPLATFGSFGGKFDPNLMVYQWDAFDPESPFYMQKKPWVAAPANNGPLSFFETPITKDNSLSINGSLPNGNYRVSYSNFNQNGLLPNSKLNRDNFSFKLTHKFSEKFTVNASANYIVTSATGRPQSGLDFRSNAMNVFRHWWQVNIDVKEMEDLYFLTRRNISPYGNGSIGNMYWERYENYSSDDRSRTIGQISLQYDITKWLNILGRISGDNYSYFQEERINVGSRKVPMYSRTNRTFSEINYEVMANFNKEINPELNIDGLLGINLRRNKMESIMASTNGGLIIPRLFSLSNSVNPPAAPVEQDIREGVNGYFGSVSAGYKSFLYLSVTGRVDNSSTLPENHSSYFYPSITTSFIFSNFIKSEFLSFGKLRLNYASVGNSAPPNSLNDVLIKPVPYGSAPMYAVNKVKNNADLKPEITSSFEAGLELSFLNNRINADISIYQANSKNQIIPVTITPATGYNSKFVNAGEMRNRGIELVVNSTIVKTQVFQWDATMNWAINKNRVLSLFEGVDNLQLGFSSVSLNAQVGHPYGMLKGTDFVYINGGRLVNQKTGAYEITSRADIDLGNINPDWTGGIRNDFKIRNIRFGFLVDVSQGGNVYSSNLRGGNATGAYKMVYTATDKPFNSTGENELGNPIRDMKENGGGIVLTGVDEAGNPNKVRTNYRDNTNTFGRGPYSMYIFDASYAKLRQASISYSLPAALIQRVKLTNAVISLIGSNLWIIHKNLPYSDPEAGTSSGNFQGIPHSELPATRNIGMSIKLQF